MSKVGSEGLRIQHIIIDDVTEYLLVLPMALTTARSGEQYTAAIAMGFPVL